MRRDGLLHPDPPPHSLRAQIAQMGAIPHLVEMVSSTSEVEALMAAGCLASLAINSASNQVRPARPPLSPRTHVTLHRRPCAGFRIVRGLLSCTS